MATDSAEQTPSRIGQEVARARGLLEKNQFVEAISVAEAVLEEEPHDRDALYILAVSQRYLNRLDEALATLVRLELTHPQYARLHQERGHCYRALAGQRAAAALSYETAVSLNPALRASWKALAELYRNASRFDDAANATEQLSRLSSLPPALVAATSLMHEGNFHEAERLCRQFLQTQGQHPEGMRLLAELGARE